MKEIFNLVKTAKKKKSKYPKSETTPYNPWAVCNSSTSGKKEDPEGFERCVQSLKKQNRKKNKSKKKSSSAQSIKEAAAVDFPFEGNKAGKIDKDTAISKMNEIYQEAAQVAAKGDIRKLDILKQMYEKVLTSSLDVNDPEFIQYADQIRQLCPANLSKQENAMASREIFNLIK